MSEHDASNALADRAESHREVIHTLRCSSDACRQGRRTCPTPDACFVAEPPDAGKGAMAATLAFAAFAVLAACATAHFLARMFS